MGHTTARVWVFDRVAKWRNFSCHFAKKVLHQVILKIIGKITGIICGGVSFQNIIGRWLDSSNCLKGTLLKRFSWEFSKTSKTAVSLNIPWKTYEVIFYKRLVSKRNPVTSIKCRHRPFSGKRPTIWELSQETSSLEFVFAEIGLRIHYMCFSGYFQSFRCSYFKTS